MTDAEADISDTLKAKSDQVNADELLGGPITVTITDVSRFDDDKQPLGLSIGQSQQDGKDKPFKPCKTMRRLLVAMWGKDPRVWIGRSLRLLRDPTVVYSGKTLGGIRCDAASHITKPFEMTLCEVRGKPKTFVIQPLKPAATKTAAHPPAAKPAATELTLVEKYAKRLAELLPDEIEAAYFKFDELAPTMDEAVAQEIYKLFAKYRIPNE